MAVEPQQIAPTLKASYFAPAVQIVSLPKQLAAGEQQGKLLPEDVLYDLVRAEVTLVNTGCSQFSLTFNNWITSTARDRAAKSGGGEPVANQVSWPRYKYNDFQQLCFGNRLRVDLRYWPDVPEKTYAAEQRAHAWTPMISGPITDMKYSFGQGAELTISGEDDLSRLKDRHQGRKELSNPLFSERQLVEKILGPGFADFPLKSIAKPRVPWPSFTENAQQGVAEALDDNQSYYEYLDKLAQRLDFEIFVAFSNLANPSSGLEFHFEPDRSRAKPDEGEVFILDRDKHLLEFSPTIRLVDQPTEVIVKGRHQDRSKPERVREIASLDLINQVLKDELPVDDSRNEKELVCGPAIRHKYFENRSNPLTVPNATNVDKARAEWLVQVAIRRKAREFFTIEATTVGLPRLRPGNYVEIRGMRPPFDGFYYLTKTVHTYGADGYRTRLTGRRPGMPEPPY